MKKRFGFLALLFVSLSLAACGKQIDGATAKLQQAYDNLSGLIGDPSNITAGFQVPTTLVNGVTAEWSSDEPGVVSFGAPVSGYANATVNRPAKDAGDAKVTISALLSLQSELSEDILTKTWALDLTVKENTVAALLIENIDDILAIKDPAYAGKLNVTLNDMTIFARSVGDAFAYDGTGSIQLFGAPSSVAVNKVYTVSGTIDWYFGIWEIKNVTATEQTSSTPVYPTKQVIDSVDAKIAELVAAGEQNYGLSGNDASAGNFEPIYARVTGKVHVIPNDNGNYNTWILDDENTTGYVAGVAKTPTTSEVPANGLMVYYQTSDFALIREYNGIIVTIDVIIYTYRSNNNGFAIYYVGGPTGVDATLTDAQKQTIDANSLSVPTSITTATTLTLPALGVNGSAIAWSSSDPAIDATTGVVTLPATGYVKVTLTASVTFGTLPAVVKTFVVFVGEQDITTLASLLTKFKDDVLYSEAEVLWVASNGKSAVVGDSSGYAYIFNSTALTLKTGNFYGFNYTLDIYKGFVEMTKVSVLSARGTDPNLTPVASTWTSAEASAFASSGDNWSPSYVAMEVIGFASGTYFNAYLPGFGSRYIQTNGATSAIANKKVTATGWIIGKSADKLTIQGAYTNPVDATDAEKLAVSVGLFKAPAANAAVVANITLPSVVFGAITWTSSNPAVISNAGDVTRPAIGQPDVTLTLSYVITVGTLSTEPVAIEFTVKAEEPVVIPENRAVVNTLSGVSSISELTSPATGGTGYTDATLSTLFTTASDKFASVTASNKIYTSEDTQAMKLGTGSIAGTLTVNMASGYVATKISVVFHAYKVYASVLTIAGGTETTASQSIAATSGTADYTTGTATVELTSTSGLPSFTLATTSAGYRVFIYSITVDYIAVV